MESTSTPSVYSAIASMEIGQDTKKRKKNLLDAYEASVLEEYYIVCLNFKQSKYNTIKAFSRDEFTLDRLKGFCMDLAKACEVDNKDLRPLLQPSTVVFKYHGCIIADDRTLLCIYLNTKDADLNAGYRWMTVDIAVCWPGSDVETSGWDGA